MLVYWRLKELSICLPGAKRAKNKAAAEASHCLNKSQKILNVSFYLHKSSLVKLQSALIFWELHQTEALNYG